MSHVFGQATFDSSFQEEREQLLESAQSSSEHFQAGLIGLTSGVFGGVTSLITQPYKGALEYGVGVSHANTITLCLCSSRNNHEVKHHKHKHSHTVCGYCTRFTRFIM